MLAEPNISMSNKETKLIRTAVFDVCDTMYYSNTTHDFVQFVFDKKSFSLRKFIYKLSNSRLLPLRYFLIIIGVLTGWDLLKKLNIYLLKGMSASQLSAISTLFVSEFLQKRQISQIHRLINKYIGEGLRIVLCSSSIEPVIKAVAENLGIKDFVSTSLKFDGEIFTGQILEEITNKKLEVLEDRRLSGNIEYAVSDNITDLKLLLAASEGIAIVHNKNKHDYWRKYKVKIIDLNL